MPFHQKRIGMDFIYATCNGRVDQLELHVIANLQLAAEIEIRGNFEGLVDGTQTAARTANQTSNCNQKERAPELKNKTPPVRDGPHYRLLESV